MVDVGLGQLATSTGRYISRKLKDAITDAHPFMMMMKAENGIRRIDGGRTITDEGLTGQNNTVSWVGESGTVPLTDQPIMDSPEFPWKYQLASIVWTLAERYKNGGGSDTKLIDIVSKKYEAAEASMMNEFHEGMLSNGTGSGGLQLNGLASLVSTTPNTGTVGTIDRSNANALWFRNQKFDTATDWALGPTDQGNIKQLLDKAINGSMKNSMNQISAFFLGSKHFEALTAATQAIQQITNESGTAKVGFQKMIYRGVPVYYGGGINYSGASTLASTRSYALNFKPGSVNLYFHEKAEFDLLEPVNANDQAAVSRLMFTMAAMTIGPLAKTNWVLFD